LHVSAGTRPQETIFRGKQNNSASAKPFSALEESTLPQSAAKHIPIEAATQ
jgi:hypothetical protein